MPPIEGRASGIRISRTRTAFESRTSRSMVKHLACLQTRVYSRISNTRVKRPSIPLSCKGCGMGSARAQQRSI